MASNNLKVVILAGGAGTRLWPMSTKEKPKQFQALISEKTMLQETFQRVSFLAPEDIFISTNAEYVYFVREQLPQVPEENIIAEPAMRDTAPCIGLAASMIAARDPEAVMAVVYADHLVKDEEEFAHKLKVTAALAAEENTLNIIEVHAKTPNTNLGYVRIGGKIADRDGVEIHEFKEFKEKPDLATAEQFISSGDYLWNTGFYVWRVDRILAEFAKHLPQTHAQLQKIQAGGAITAHYPLCEKISIDYGIMEKVDPADVRIIPADLGWSDIGTWASLHKELAGHPNANVIKGHVVELDAHGNLIYNQSGNETDELNLFGITNTIVVQYEGQTLIMPMDQSSDLKKFLNKKNG